MGFLGLEDRFTGTWNGGRTVTVYPDGTVVDVNTGEFIRLPEIQRQGGYMGVSNTFMMPQSKGLDKDVLVLVLVLAFALALVALKK